MTHTLVPEEPTENELLPCPFCGGEAERIDIEDGENAGGSCVHCTQCDACSNVEFEFKENFVSNWNRRVAAPKSEPDAWLPISTARKDGTSYLLKFRGNLQAIRIDLERWNNLQFVGSHPGLCRDGFDVGWSFAAPVGMGGFPDDWFVGWRPIGDAPQTDAVKALVDALHHISLCSQNSMSSKEECGRIARKALAKFKEGN